MTALPDVRAALSIPMTAVAVDGRIELDTLARPEGWESVHRGPNLEVWRQQGVRVRFFDFGAAVIENRAALDSDLRQLIENATGRQCLDATTESTLLLVDPTRDSMRPRVGWDRVVVHDAETTTREAVSHLLAQSAAMDRYAKEADGLLGELLTLARELEATGALPRSSRKLNMRVGHIIARRLELARWFYTLDRPESAWSEPKIFELHEALADNLELKERHQSVLHKLEAVEEAVDTVTDLWHGRRSLSLEWTVVLLILFEIVMAFVQRH
jgi:uncharacterized Rmd1/YagE family protein